MDVESPKRAMLQALLVTDGSVTPKGNQISFANTSNELIRRFCKLMYGVYRFDVPESRIYVSKGTRQRLFIVQFRSKEICKDLLEDMDYSTKRGFIPEYWSRLTDRDISAVLRNLFDADGGCSVRVVWLRKKNCFEIKREVFLACKNPTLRKQYRELLIRFGIKTGDSSDKVTISSKEGLSRFKKHVNFSRNVLIGFDSKHWQGLEKRKLLSLALKTYSIPWGEIQEFDNKKDIYNILASF
jgi:hypothetical protein